MKENRLLVFSRMKILNSSSLSILLLTFTSSFLFVSTAISSSTSPISISLPLPLASVPQPVTIKQNPVGGNGINTNNNDVIGYIVVPYPGIDQRSDPLQQPLFNLLPGSGAAASYANLARNTGLNPYRRYGMARGGYPYSPFLNPLINPLAYSAFPGYGSLYGYTPRYPLLNFLG